MASIYKIKIKTVSAFCAYDVEYVKKVFTSFLEAYRDDKTGLRFENTEVNVVKDSPETIYLVQRKRDMLILGAFDSEEKAVNYAGSSSGIVVRPLTIA